MNQTICWALAMNLQLLEPAIATPISGARQPRAWRFAWPVIGLFAVCLFATAAFALDPQKAITQFVHTAWRTQDGIVRGAPSAIAQTTDGYVWIGTQNGLVRFDGVRFVQWTPRGGERLSSSIVSLLAGRDGSLWIGTGANLAHLKDGDLTNYLDASGRINSIVEDHNGTIWIARSRVHDTAGPLCEVTGTKLRCHGRADGITAPYAVPLVEDSGGNLWIGSTKALIRWRNGSSTTYAPSGVRTAEGLNGIEQLALAPDGSLWVGSTRPGPGLGLQQFVQGAWKPFIAPDLNGRTLQVSALLLDRENALWVGTTDQGIYRVYDGGIDRFRNADGLSSDSVNSFYEDREGNLWVASSGGIDCFRDTRVVSFPPARD
jgi:ligand-binding sensor domain-containing protein